MPLLSLLLAVAQTTEKAFVELVRAKGPEQAAIAFHQMRRENSKVVPFREPTMNNLGYEWLTKKDYAGAIKLFSLNVEAYPTSSNAEDSLGEAYMNAGRKREAAQHYRKALTMQPSSERQVAILKDLGYPVSPSEWTQMFKRVMPADVEFRPNVVYAKPGGSELRLDMVRPKQRPGRLPLLIFLHGGGWSAGTKERGILPLVYFARNGFATATVEYRLGPKYIFPTQIQDVKRAIQFLRGRAGSLGIDANRIAVWGQSAGGHLAAMAGTTAGMKFFDPPGPSTRVQAVIDWNGPTDLAANPASLKVTDPVANGINRFLGGALKDRLQLAKLANPIRYVSHGDAPFLIVHGDSDREVPLTQSQMLLKALLKHKVPARLVVLKGEDHFGPDELPPGQIARLQKNDPDALARTMVAFLREKLKVSSPPQGWRTRKGG